MIYFCFGGLKVRVPIQMVLIPSYCSEWPKMNLTISKILVQTWNTACAIPNTNKGMESWNKQTGVFCLTETVCKARGYIVTISRSISQFVLVCSTHIIHFFFLDYHFSFRGLGSHLVSTLHLFVSVILQEEVTKR